MVLANCAGREPKAIALTNPTDSTLDCPAIQREFEANERQILSLVEERTGNQVKNAMFTTVGVVVFLPALFFIDLKPYEKTEIQAFRNRNQVLEDLGRTKKCKMPESRLTEFYKQFDGAIPPAANETLR